MSDSNSNAVTVAIIGAGEMGAAVGRRLREMGARVITPLRGRSAESVERVRQARLEVVAGDGAPDCGRARGRGLSLCRRGNYRRTTADGSHQAGAAILRVRA